MNNIHEKDWASGCWSGHTGMNSFDDYCVIDAPVEQAAKEPPTAPSDTESTKKNPTVSR